jgi:pimeloyl-ACP methyl ester carboxylesterase
VRRLALVSAPFRRDGWFPEVLAGMLLRVPTLLVYGDADSIPPSHAAEFFALLGGGLHDAGLDGTPPTDMRLAILPGLSHYNIFQAPQLPDIVAGFIS